jgi:hypothetical protein
LRYVAFVAVALVAFFLAVGMGAAASLVVGWQSERGATGPDGPTGPTGPAMSEGTAPETTDEARVTEGTAIESADGAEGPGAGGSAERIGPAEGSRFVHRATPENSRGDYTYLDDPDLNGDPNAVVLAAPTDARGGEYEHNVGVWFEPEARKWAIFNQDLAPVPEGATFRVSVPQEGRGFVYRAGPDDTFGNTTYLDDPRLNGEPDARVSVAQNWNPGGGNGVYNDHAVGARYDEDVEKWFVYNKDGARIPEGAAFNVAVSGTAEPAS